MARNVNLIGLETVEGLGAGMVFRLKEMIQTRDENIYIMRTDKDLFVCMTQPNENEDGLEAVLVHGHERGTESMDVLGIEETTSNSSIILNFNETAKTESGRAICTEAQIKFLTVYPKAMGEMQ